MQRFSLVLIILFIICSAQAMAPQADKSSSRPIYATDLIKIQLSSSVSRALKLPSVLNEETGSFNHYELDKSLREVGGTAIIKAHRSLKNKAWESANGFDRWYLIRLDGSVNAQKAVAVFAASPYIEHASPEYFAYTQITPNDPYYNQNWGHNNTGQGPGGGGSGFDSNAPEAWDQSQGFGSPDVIIAIIDSGVNYNHVDLNDNCITGWDYGSNDSNPIDQDGHGTQCAGVAAGEANNAVGITGVAGGCKIMPIKAMSNNGDITFTAITNALTHAADNGAKVISMSIGAENNMAEGNDLACDGALNYAYAAGCTILAATANSNAAAIAYPANHHAVISVGAASPTGQRKSPSSSDNQNWWGSNYGVNIQDDTKAVDIMAATILPATNKAGTYSFDFNGTSCATPYAAGVAALVLSKDPGLSPAEVRTAIVSTATDMTIDGGVGWDRFTGYGMINADAAVASVAIGMPTCTITAPANNSIHAAGSTIIVSVNSTDSDGTIDHVSFYLDDTTMAVSTDDSAPYEWSWDTQEQAPWEHTIKAVATDNEGNIRLSTVNIVLLTDANEGFESAMNTSYAWENTSLSPWIIQAVDYYSGYQSAKAGTISHNQNTALSITLNVIEAGEISFFRKVSCENNYDYLRFFIDEVQQAQWTGSMDWARQHFAVQPGTRTFTWTYIKDQGVNSGSDTAWLDHINFPPHNAPPAAPSALIATAISPSRIALNWEDNSSNETEFYVETLNFGFWELVNWTLQDVTDIISFGLQPGTSYSYRVKSYNDNGGSLYSNIATTMTLDANSPDDVLSAADANFVQLSWSAPNQGAESYQVWRYPILSGIPGTGINLSPEPITSTSYTDASWHLQNPGLYLWKIIAYGAGAYSAPSISNALDKAANGILQGTVTSESGIALENVVIDCGTLNTLTNNLGEYSLSILPGLYSLTASLASYEPLTQTRISVSSDLQTVVDFQLPLIVANSDEIAPALSGIQNIYPNPFHGSTQIEIELKDASIPYSLGIYNLRGELVYRHNGQQKGRASIQWNGQDINKRKLGSGLYFVKLNHGKTIQTRKLMLY